MSTADSNQANPKMPLTDKDNQALDEIFGKVKVEDIKQIEATAVRRSTSHIEPWEEKGWVVNSFIPKRQ